MPRRTSAWSSTIRILMSSTCSPDGEHGDDRGAASRSRSDVEPPAERFGTGTHDAYPEVGVPILHRRDAAAAVLDLDTHLFTRDDDPDVCQGRARVLRGVREGFAHDGVHGLQHVLAGRFELSFDVDRDGEVPADAEIAHECG